MRQFNAIENTTLAVAPNRPSPRIVETGNARAIARGRQFHVLNDGTNELFPHIDPQTGGAFLADDRAQHDLRHLRSINPNIPLIIEPQAIRRRAANRAHQFFDDDGAGLGVRGLEAVINEMRNRGADCALTPTAQIQEGDTIALRRAIETANHLDRDDVILAVPVAANWLSKADLSSQLARALNESRHQVALTFFSTGTNYMHSRPRLRGLRNVIASTEADVIAYRMGLEGMDAVAHGATASAIGSYPSVRGLHPAGRDGGRNYPPHVLIGDVLEYFPAVKLRDDWFRTMDAPTCACVICDGEKIDRFYAFRSDRRKAHQHNTIEVGRLFSSLTSLGLEGMSMQWGNLVQGAKVAYADLQNYAGRPVKMPICLEVWSETTVV